MTNYQAWTIAIAAISAIATFAAVVVALWLGVWQVRKQYNRNVVVGFRNNRRMEIDGVDTHCLEITIYNVGNAVCAVEHLLLNKLFSLPVQGREPLFLEPQMIGVGETMTFVCRFEDFIFAINSNLKHKRIKETTPLIINAMDITGKMFSRKIGHTVGEYLAWDNDKDNPDVSLLPRITE